MKSSRIPALIAILALAAGPARAQDTDAAAEGFKAGLMQALSVASFGMLSAPAEAASVTRDGSDYAVRLPLTGLTEPADAAVTVVGRPMDDGMMDIASLTFPSSGTLELSGVGGLSNRMSFVIGQQAFSGTIDPTLAKPSRYSAEFKDVRMKTLMGQLRGQQDIARYSATGSFFSSSDGRLNFQADGKGSDFHATSSDATHVISDMGIGAMSARFSAEGLDRAQGQRLVAAWRLMAANMPQPVARPPGPPGSPPPAARPPSPEQLAAMTAMLDATPGLLRKFDLEETIDRVRFKFGSDTAGGEAGIDRMLLALSADASGERLATHMRIGVDGIAVPSLPPDTADFLPRHIDLRTAIRGVDSTALLGILRAAIDRSEPPAVLQAKALGLLSDPNARVTVESLAFDSGPLSVKGDARLVSLPSGNLGGEVHLSARGIDAMVARAQGDPKMQKVLPMIFLAKGMGRPEGDALAWDIKFGDGPPVVNGTPMGAPQPRAPR